MNEAKLKACPFCGNPATVETRTIKDKEYYAIGCDNVACRGSAWAGDPDAVRAVSRWNERAGDRKPAIAKTPAISTLASSNGSADRYEREWIITIKADTQRGAMDAVWQCWEAWSKGHEPVGGNMPRGMGDPMTYDVKRVKEPSLPNDQSDSR